MSVFFFLGGGGGGGGAVAGGAYARRFYRFVCLFVCLFVCFLFLDIISNSNYGLQCNGVQN